MKNLLIDVILFIFTFVGFGCLFLGFYMTDFINFETYFILSFLTAAFWTKSHIDKTNLENKIFELKELIKKLEK